jgi:hypothetical protein
MAVERASGGVRQYGWTRRLTCPKGPKMAINDDTSLEELFAERDQLNEHIAKRLADLRQPEIERQKQAELDVMQACLPVHINGLFRHLRMHSIAVVFHDGHLENGPVGRSTEDAVVDAVAMVYPDVGGFSDKFRSEMVRALLDIRIFDASKGFDRFKEGARSRGVHLTDGTLGT